MSKYKNEDIEKLAAMFKALSSVQRLRIFIKLAGMCCIPKGRRGASKKATYCCAGELGANLDLAASTVSHHLKELRQAGLMRVERRGQKIDCWVSPDTVRLLAAFFEEYGPTRG